MAPAQASPAGAAHNSYSHLIFAIQWSGGVCADRRSDNRSVSVADTVPHEGLQIHFFSKF